MIFSIILALLGIAIALQPEHKKMQILIVIGTLIAIDLSLIVMNSVAVKLFYNNKNMNILAPGTDNEINTEPITYMKFVLILGLIFEIVVFFILFSTLLYH
jgi:hypothetical protein